MSQDVGEQESMLTGFQLRSSANRNGRDWCSRRSLRDEICDVRDVVEIVGDDLRKKVPRNDRGSHDLGIRHK